LACAIAQRVPYLPALGVSLAGSFVNRLAPVKVAGAALNIRFLQKRGTDPLTAIAGVGLIAMAGGISHIVVTSVSLLAAGQQQDGLPFTLPDTNLILLGAAAILILVGVVLWVPRTAQLVKDKVVPALVSTKENLKSLAGTPRKIVGLFVGGMLVPVSYSLCLYFSVEAFGGGDRDHRIGCPDTWRRGGRRGRAHRRTDGDRNRPPAGAGQRLLLSAGDVLDSGAAWLGCIHIAPTERGHLGVGSGDLHAAVARCRHLRCGAGGHRRVQPGCRHR
jgi:hypothetical protein